MTNQKSETIYKDDIFEVIQINSVEDLVALSKNTFWYTNDKKIAQELFEKGHYYLVMKNEEKYCKVNPIGCQIQNIYCQQLSGKDEKDIMDLFCSNNFIPIDEIVLLILGQQKINKERYNQCSEIAMEIGKNNIDIAFHLLSKKITNDNIYIKIAIKNAQYAYYLLTYNIITKDNEYFDIAIESAIRDGYNACMLLEDKIIIEDNPFFNQALESSIEEVLNAYELLINEIITPEHPSFDKVVLSIMRDEEYSSYLLKNNIVPSSNPLYEKIKFSS